MSFELSKYHDNLEPGISISTATRSSCLAHTLIVFKSVANLFFASLIEASLCSLQPVAFNPTVSDKCYSGFLAFVLDGEKEEKLF